MSESEGDMRLARPAAAVAAAGELGARNVVDEIERAIGYLQGELGRRERDEALREQAARERRIALAALATRMDEAGRLAGDLDGVIDAGAEEGARLIIARLRAVVAAVAGALPQLADGADDSSTGAPGALAPAVEVTESPTGSGADPQERQSALGLATDPPELLRRPEFFDPDVIMVAPQHAAGGALDIADRSEPARRPAVARPDRPPDPWRYVRPPARPAPGTAAQPAAAAALEIPPPERPRRTLTWPGSRPINRLLQRLARSRGSVADATRDPDRVDR